jgi:hypothetical protein
MDESSVAHELPELYRDVLDRIASVERLGYRREGQLLRAEAIKVYSASWNDGAIRAMEGLRTRADRVRDGDERPRRPRSESRALRYLRLRRLAV